MKLLLIFAAVLAFSLAEKEKNAVQVLEDSEAEESANIELLKAGVDLDTAASQYDSYVPPSQRPSRWDNANYVAPQNTWNQPKPVEQPTKPWVPPVQNDYYWSTGAPHYHHSTTTTPVPVLHQSHYIGDNGDYKFEYQIGDGTHVGEQGYFTDPKRTEESLVKKGWYSWIGADGKTYTVNWYADHTGYHAYGDHLPTPSPAPKPVHGQHQNQQWKPQNDYPAPTPAPVSYPTQAPIYHPPTATPAPYPTYPPTYKPPQPTYQPPQATYAPPVNNQGYVPQVTYPQQQQTYYPSQQQQSYYPTQQQTYPSYSK